jgi:hypothetical protein
VETAIMPPSDELISLSLAVGRIFEECGSVKKTVGTDIYKRYHELYLTEK